jgi:fatty acid amide hydrolase
LRVGVFEDDGFLTPARSIRRAVRIAAEALEKAGAEVVPYQPPGADELIYLWLGAITADGGRTIERKLSGEPISPQLKPSQAFLKLPALARQALSRILGVAGERRLSRLLRVLGEKPLDAYWDLTRQRTALRWAEFDGWNRAGLDAVICPPHVVPALPHRWSGDFTLSLGYAFRWSLLNFPAGIVPVTRVTPEEARPQGSSRKRDRVEKKQADIEAGSAGLPVGVQVVARPWQEDRVLRIMELVEAYACLQEGFPRTPTTP